MTQPDAIDRALDRAAIAMAEHDDRPTPRPDGARRQPRRLRERRELPEQILLPAIPEVDLSGTTPATTGDTQPLSGDVDWATAEPTAPSATIGIGTDLNIAPLFLGGTNAPAMADATPTIEPMDIAVEPSAAVATEMQTVAVPPVIPEPAEVAQELAPAIPAEPQFVAGEAVVEEISEEATAAPAIGRADNDPRATPRAVTQLEVVKALAAVAGKTPRIVFVPREVIEREGGRPVRSRVGHSFIKAHMRREDAVFGGEHSGHFYFRDNWYADSGLIAFLTVHELLSNEGLSVSEYLAPIDTRFRSGEINSEVADVDGAIARVREAFADGEMDELDGLTVNYPTWWFNLRPSNTQPLLRLNVEADTKEQLDEQTAAVLGVIRGQGA